MGNDIISAAASAADADKLVSEIANGIIGGIVGGLNNKNDAGAPLSPEAIACEVARVVGECVDDGEITAETARLAGNAAAQGVALRRIWFSPAVFFCAQKVSTLLLLASNQSPAAGRFQDEVLRQNELLQGDSAVKEAAAGWGKNFEDAVLRVRMIH